MLIIEVKALLNGAHRNQTVDNLTEVLEGWVVVPDEIEVPDTFPFVDIEVEDGVVTSMTAGVIPEPETEEVVPTAEDDLMAMAVDHEYRITLLELGISEL